MPDKPYIFNYRNFIAHSRGVDPSTFDHQKTAPKDLDFTILDGQRCSQNKLEKLNKAVRKISRIIQQKFPTSATFSKDFKSIVRPDEEGNVHASVLKDYFLESLDKEFNDKSVNKDDIENFLSAFVFTKYGLTDVENFGPRIYSHEFDPTQEIERALN